MKILTLQINFYIRNEKCKHIWKMLHSYVLVIAQLKTIGNFLNNYQVCSNPNLAITHL
jgi:hypothetical protein